MNESTRELDFVAGAADARLTDPAPGYVAIARLKASLVERTGLLGMASVEGGRHLVFRHFLSFGTDAQRAAWSGKALSVAISEPNVGAHPKLLTTRAECDGGVVRITGQKAWVSNGPSADAIIVFAITSEEAGRKRYSAFIVPRDTPGLTMTDMPGFHALRPSKHCLLTLDGCLVPDSAMLGAPGSAYDYMALPFRDVEDAAGTFGTLGAFRYAIGLFAGANHPQPAKLGAIAGLIAVFEAAAERLVASLDAGGMRTGDATLIGLRVLTTHLIDLLIDADKIPGGSVVVGGRLAEILAGLDATLNIARGPRLARQTHLGEAALRPRKTTL